MDVQFITSVAMITPDPDVSRGLYVDALGLPLTAEGDGYLGRRRRSRTVSAHHGAVAKPPSAKQPQPEQILPRPHTD